MKKIIFLLAMFFTISAYSQSAVIESAKIPKQTGNAGKYLKTNGSKLAWTNVTAGLTASLTPNYIPYAVSSSSLSNSEIFQTGAGFGSTVTVAGVVIKNRGIDMTGNNKFWPGEIVAEGMLSTNFLITNSGYINSTGVLNISTNYKDVSICNGGGNVGIGTDLPTSKLHVVGLIEYADNTAATLAGLTIGAFYRTGDILKVVH